MKKNVLLAIILLFGFVGAQINFLHTFEGYFYPNTNSYNLADENLNVCYSLYPASNPIKIYNEDFSERTSVNIQVPDGYQISNMSCLSEKIFNTDSKLEFIVVFSSSNTGNQKNIMRLYDENGNVLKDFGTSYSINAYLHLTSNGDYRLYAIRYDASTSPSKYYTDVYSLPGKKEVMPNSHEHDISNWVVTKMPTKDEDGEVKGSCTASDCDYTRTVTIKKLGEDNVSSSNNIRSENKYGIVLENAVVSDVAKIEIKTPEDALLNIIISDNLGNIMFETSGKSTETFSWNLKNKAGRFVGKGSYLIIADAKGVSGKTFVYSAKLGVKK
jgi:hypothetical protein